MMFSYTYRSMPYIVIIRDASSGSSVEQTQTPTARHYEEKGSKCEVFIKSRQSSENLAEEEAEMF